MLAPKTINNKDYFAELSAISCTAMNNVKFDLPFLSSENNKHFTLRDMMQDFLFLACGDIYETPDPTNKIIPVLVHSAFSVSQLARLFRETNRRHYIESFFDKKIGKLTSAGDYNMDDLNDKLFAEYFYIMCEAVFRQSVCLVCSQEPVYYIYNYHFLLTKTSVDELSLKSIAESSANYNLDYRVETDDAKKVSVFLKANPITSSPTTSSPAPAGEEVRKEVLYWQIAKTIFDRLLAPPDTLSQKAEAFFLELKITEKQPAPTAEPDDMTPAFETESDKAEYAKLVAKLESPAEKPNWDSNVAELVKFMQSKKVQAKVKWVTLSDFEKRWITFLYFFFHFECRGELLARDPPKELYDAEIFETCGKLAKLR